MEKKRIEEILVNNSSLVSGLSEASGVRLSWVEVSQESLKKFEKQIGENRPIEGLLRAFEGLAMGYHVAKPLRLDR